MARVCAGRAFSGTGEGGDCLEMKQPIVCAGWTDGRWGMDGVVVFSVRTDIPATCTASGVGKVHGWLCPRFSVVHCCRFADAIEDVRCRLLCMHVGIWRRVNMYALGKRGGEDG